MALFKIKGCDTPCPLKKEWPYLRNPRMPMTLPKIESPFRVLVVGEGPGEAEDDLGVPFVGKTGKYLRGIIPFEWRERLYWQNVVRCRPPKNRTPEPHEIDCCSSYLEKDLETANPHAVLAVGGVALSYFYGATQPNISHIRGIPFPIQVKGNWTWCFPIFHPSFVARSDRTSFDDGSVLNSTLPVFREDIKNFFANLNNFTTPPNIVQPPRLSDGKYNILYPKTGEEAWNLFNKLKDPFALDIETNKLKPYLRDAHILTAAFSDGDLTFAFIVDWPGGNRNTWGKDIFKKMMLSNRRWIAQNSLMELKWVWFLTNWAEQTFEDTEILARLMHERKGLGSLDVLTRIYLGFDIKKLSNLDKNKLADYSVDKVLQYNGLDAWSEVKVYHKLLNALPVEQFPNYFRSIESVRSTVAMELRGLNVDLKVSAELEKHLYAKGNEINQAAHVLEEVKTYEKQEQKIFSISSPQSVAAVLTKYCNIKLEKTESNNFITDEDALEKLVDAHPLVNLTLDFREMQKLRSTYIKPILSLAILGVDGLLHAAYTVVHTATYRLSSHDPNIQNFPKRAHKEIRRQVVPREGFIFAAFDYGQLEARTLVMASKDEVLKKSFVNKEDIHSKWLNRLLEMYPEYIYRLKDKTNQTDEKAIRKAGRDIIKSDFVFASFYGSVAKSVANRAMLPMQIAEDMLGEFWGEYRGVRKWIDNQFTLYEKYAAVESLTGRRRNEILPGNEVINSPIQGTAAEIVLEAQNALFKRAMAEDINLLPRINIHDDLVFELPDGNDAELQQYINLIGNEIVKPRFPFINLPLMTECRIGYDWADLSDVVRFEGKEYGS